MYRNKNCGELNIKNVGENVVIAGWVQRIRNLGSMKFIDLRDQFGITQIIVNDNCADNLVTECVIQVDGTVIERTNKNSKIPTGEIEIEAKKIEVLGTCKNILPFEVNSEKAADAREDLRLEYRFLDLRNEKLHKTIILRSEIMKTIRNKMDELGFTEIQTPILANSSPEGARDFLVPSRLHPGEFYALPQAPQQFKQLLMVSGFDKYYQIAPCFRDEDPRADRAPGEFYQLDFEMSFAEQKDVLSVLEDIFTTIFKKHTNWKITDTPFPRIPYKEAMEKYGSDKPDLRFGMEITNITEAVKDMDFVVFKSAIENGGSVRALCLKGGASLGRKPIDKLGEFVKTYRAKGLAWIQLKEEGVKSSLAKFLTDDVTENIVKTMGAETGDAIFIVADKDSVVLQSLGALRLELAKQFDLIKDKNEFNFTWVTEFPFFEYSEEEERFKACHHPFTSPMDEDLDMIETNPGAVRSKAYDLVLNGEELGGGSIRIHDSELQTRMFKALGFTEESAYERFGFLIDAFKFGPPPHGGLAFGLDRMIMFLAGTENIKDVIAFPKNQNAYCYLSEAPNVADSKQIEELGLIINKIEK